MSKVEAKGTAPQAQAYNQAQAANPNAAAAGAAAAPPPAKKKVRDHHPVPDEEHPYPLGKYERIKGSVDQIHAFKVFGTRFALDSRYVPTKGIGRGAYGVVISATDVDKIDKTGDKSNCKVAIKKIPHLFQDSVDSKRNLREVKLLRHFRHENIVGLRDLIPSSNGAFDEIYLVLDFMDTDLYKIIYSANALSDEHIQYFLYQLLRGLKYIHSANVIHRDLKPSNLLLNANCHLKICDFGLARGLSEQEYMTEYVVTRWYRAPEIMCSALSYDAKIDVWSAGCIFAELFMRSPIFPGEDYKHQLNLIFGVLGTPTPEDFGCITNEFAAQYIRSLTPRPKIPLAELIANVNGNTPVNPDAIDLLEKMLVFDPAKRITVEEALEHPYLAALHNPSIEFICKKPWVPSFEDELTGANLTVDNVRMHFKREIYKFRPHLKAIDAEEQLHEGMRNLDIAM